MKQAPFFKESSNADNGDSILQNAGDKILDATMAKVVNDYNYAAILPAVLVAPIISGIHASAWNYPFPTVVERWLWRVAVIVVGVGPFWVTVLFAIASVGFYLVKKYPQLTAFDQRISKAWTTGFTSLAWARRENILGSLLRLVALLVSFLVSACSFVFIGLYVPLRIFVLVEVFMSLRKAPMSIYQSPDWSSYLPHWN